MTASSHISRDELIASGRDALLAGDHARARELLDTAVRLDPGDAEAWLWLSGTETEPAAMVVCLNRALALDPHSQQAREGLRWIAETYGDNVAYAPDNGAPAHTFDAARWHLLAEAAVYPFVAGALLGLTRLVGWLRPDTLWELRPDGSALGFGGALLLAFVAVAGHGAALLAAWAVLGGTLGATRGSDRGDMFDSLLRAGGVFEPGLVWGVALGLAVFGLLFAPLVWPVAVLVCWLALTAGVALIGLRLRRLLHALNIVPLPAGLSSVAACVVVALLGCWLAGIAAAAVM